MIDLVPLGSVATLNPQTPRELFTDITKPVAFVSMSSIGEDGTLKHQDVRQVGELLQGYTYFADGDVVVAKITPCLQNGKAALLSGLKSGHGFGSTEFHVLRAGPKLDKRYLFYMVWSPDFRRFGEQRFTGSAGQKRMPATAVAEFGIPIPFPEDPRRSLAEQKRIAAILDKADAIRRRRQEAARLADTLGSSLFLDRYQPYFREADKHRLVPLEECCERITDGVHITPTYVNDGVPFLRITDIKNGSVDWKSVRQIPRVEYEEITRRTRPGRGDVLYSKNGTIGIPIEVTWDHDFAHFVSLARLSPKRDVLDPTFLCTFLGTDLALRQATSHSKTLTVTNLHLVEIRKILIPCPDLAEQRAFVHDAKRVAQACAGSAVAVAEAEALFNSLVQRAFRGEL